MVVMARYRYLLTDLRTRRILSEVVSLSVQSYSRRMSTTGELQATLDLADPAVREFADPNGATEPRRTALWVIRDEAVVWGGIIWTRRYRSADRNYDIGATSFESYFARRRIRQTLTYNGVDQHAIVARLINHAQTAVHAAGNINIAVDVNPPPAVPARLRDRTYYWHERATFLERLEQLCEVIDGPDFTIEPSWDINGVPLATLKVGSPIMRASNYVLEFPGDFRNYSWPDDGGGSANFWTAIGDPVGSGENDPPVMRDAQMSAEWDAGVPLLEDVSQHQGVTDAGTLQGYANAHVRAAAGNRVVPEATLRIPEGELPALGDSLTVRVTDPLRFPERDGGAPGVVARVRVTGFTVYLSIDEGETVTLELSEPY